MEFSLFEVILRVILLLVIALFLTVCTVAVVKLFKIDIKDVKQRTDPRFMSIALLANLLFIFSVYLLLNGLDGKNIQILVFTFTLSDMVYSLLALILTLLTALVFVYGLHLSKNYQVQWAIGNFIKKEEAGTFLFSLVVVFVAALQEEIMFRGYLSFIFQNYYFFTALMLSSGIFTIWHFIGNKVNKYQAIDWFIGGLLLFYVYIESGSIWVAAIVHFGRNLTNVFVFNIVNKHSFLHWDTPISPKYKSYYIITCSGVILILTIIVFK